MIVLGLDTSTAATTAAVLLEDGRAFEERDDPPAGERPAHAARLLELAERALAAAGAGWRDLDRVAVGVGPGGFTGLRIGVATARGLAQAHGLPLVAVGSLEALAAAAAPLAATMDAPASTVMTDQGEQAVTREVHAPDPAPVLAVIDARRGEVFAGCWLPLTPLTEAAPVLAQQLIEPVAIDPGAIAGPISGLYRPPLAVGDGAVRYRAELERAGATVPVDGHPLHSVSALQICALGALGTPVDREAIVPDYRREPDAKPQTA